MQIHSGVRVEARFDWPIEKAWAVISDFALLPTLIPGVGKIEVTGSGIGAVRRVPFENMISDERLDEQDEADHRLVYSVIEKSPGVPVEDYSAEMHLTPDGPNACRFTWQSRFTLPDTVDETAACAEVRRAYEVSIEGIRAALA
jgi:hypothetical protein